MNLYLTKDYLIFGTYGTMLFLQYCSLPFLGAFAKLQKLILIS